MWSSLFYIPYQQGGYGFGGHLNFMYRNVCRMNATSKPDQSLTISLQIYILLTINSWLNAAGPTFLPKQNYKPTTSRSKLYFQIRVIATTRCRTHISPNTASQTHQHRIQTFPLNGQCSYTLIIPHFPNSEPQTHHDRANIHFRKLLNGAKRACLTVALYRTTSPP